MNKLSDLIIDDIIRMEEKFWTSDANYYRQNLTHDFQMVYPGMGVVKREAAIEGIEQGPRWKVVDLTDVQVLQPKEGVIVISYKAKAQHEGDDSWYTALVSSVYVKYKDWKLLFHHQTPLQ